MKYLLTKDSHSEYLKRFNESINKKLLRSKLQEFCNGYLINLLDENYQVRISITEDLITYKKDKVNIRINLPQFVEFNYNTIKDYFIPFISVLNDEYPILNITFMSKLEITDPAGYKQSKYSDFKVIDIINDSVLEKNQVLRDLKLIDQDFSDIEDGTLHNDGLKYIISDSFVDVDKIDLVRTNAQLNLNAGTVALNPAKTSYLGFNHYRNQTSMSFTITEGISKIIKQQQTNETK